MTDTLLFYPEEENKRQPVPEPEFLSEEWMEWTTYTALNSASRNIVFHDIAGLSEDEIYLCGEVGPAIKPVLCYWGSETLEELKIPVEKAALTGIQAESPDSVWICSREEGCIAVMRGASTWSMPICNGVTLMETSTMAQQGATGYRNRLHRVTLWRILMGITSVEVISWALRI